jgi:hypothetical protein
MPQRAIVTSVDALEEFRASLVVYLSKARPALEEESADIMRTRSWLEDEQRLYWESQVRRRAKELEQAQQALFSARISNLREASSAEIMAVNRAKRAFEEAEGKLKTLKHWNREFDHRTQPLVKQMEKLHTVLANDMVQAVAYLTQTINTLDAYAEMAPPMAPTTSAGPASGVRPSSGVGSSGEADVSAGVNEPSAPALAVPEDGRPPLGTEKGTGIP